MTQQRVALTTLKRQGCCPQLRLIACTERSQHDGSCIALRMRGLGVRISPGALSKVWAPAVITGGQVQVDKVDQVAGIKFSGAHTF